MIATVRKLEGLFEDWCFGAGHGLSVLCQTGLELRRIGRKWQETINQTFRACFGSLAITLLTGLFTGMILALQTGQELARYGQEATIGYLVAATMCREMGPVMTGIALAGLMGSTYAAEIGSMKVNEEIDALEVMSIDPVYFLAMPRIVALGISAVALTAVADAVGVAGGALVGKSQLNVDVGVYLTNAKNILDVEDIYNGLVKSFIFGITIATIACSQGLRASGGPEGVGNSTLRTVVFSFICILMFDYFLGWMMY